MNHQARINELTDKLNYYSYQYYQGEGSDISDFEFDQLLLELGQLEQAYPALFEKILRPTEWEGLSLKLLNQLHIVFQCFL